MIIIWGRIVLGIILYSLMVLIVFRALSYQCVMAMYGCYDYSIKNFLLALFFPITILILLSKAFYDDDIYSEEEQFDKFKKKRLKEYKKMILTEDGIVKKIK
jgi:hypothetical protein